MSLHALLSAALLIGTAAGAAPVPSPRPDAVGESGARPTEPAEAAAEAPPEAPSAALRGLDKASGVATPFHVEIGAEAAFGRLRVRVEACRAGPDGDVAYLTITDAKTPEAAAFEGWMFAKSPALSALDHPRYDVWLAQCSASDAGAL